MLLVLVGIRARTLRRYKLNINKEGVFKPRRRYRLRAESGEYMGIGENTGQNIGEQTGSTGAPTIPDIPTPNFFANGDINWNNPDLSVLQTIQPVNYTDTNGIIIRFKRISNATLHAMQFWNCTGSRGIAFENGCDNIVVRNNKIIDTYQNSAAGNYEGQGVWINNSDNCTSIIVEGNWIENTSSHIILQASEYATNVKIRGNYGRNPGQSSGQSAGGSFLKLNWNGYTTGIEVHDNVSRADWGIADTEDHISVFASGGQNANPIKIYNNKIQGSGPSRSGSGIMTGDVDEPNEWRRNIGDTEVYNNVLVNPGQVGIGLAGGIRVNIHDNDIFASATSPNIDNQNGGLYVWRQGLFPGLCHSCTVQNNRVWWMSNYNGTGPYENHDWLPTTGRRRDPVDGILKDEVPNHGQCIGGDDNAPCIGDPNQEPTGYHTTNEWGYEPWNEDLYPGAAYAELVVPDRWEYYPPQS